MRVDLKYACVLIGRVETSFRPVYFLIICGDGGLV
jgi:hypothetical protein